MNPDMMTRQNGWHFLPPEHSLSRRMVYRFAAQVARVEGDIENNAREGVTRGQRYHVNPSRVVVALSR